MNSSIFFLKDPGVSWFPSLQLTPSFPRVGCYCRRLAGLVHYMVWFLSCSRIGVNPKVLRAFVFASLLRHISCIGLNNQLSIIFRSLLKHPSENGLL